MMIFIKVSIMVSVWLIISSLCFASRIKKHLRFELSLSFRAYLAIIDANWVQFAILFSSLLDYVPNCVDYFRFKFGMHCLVVNISMRLNTSFQECIPFKIISSVWQTPKQTIIFPQKHNISCKLPDKLYRRTKLLSYFITTLIYFINFCRHPSKFNQYGSPNMQKISIQNSFPHINLTRNIVHPYIKLQHNYNAKCNKM